MKLYTISKQSLRAILSNKGRSFLTVLGIVIGIGSVIALVALGNGVKDSISGQISSLGTTSITVMNGAGFAEAGAGQAKIGGNGQSGSANAGHIGGGSTSTLTKNDYALLQDKTKNPDIKLIAGNVSGSGIYNDSLRFSVQGTDVSLFTIRTLSIKTGRLFNENDVANNAKVIVIGADEVTILFGSDNPIGKTLTVGQDNYTVIGVLDKVKENNFNNLNLSMFAPYTAVMKSVDTDKFSSLAILAADDNSVDKAKTEIENTLLSSHNIKDIKLADFSVSTSADLLSTVGNITGILTSLLAGIAAISLLVGGIGIMNIMLVSVTERTREIGLRKAVGAKTSDIVTQFLIEAVILTVTGGIIGIGLGFLMAKIAGKLIAISPAMTTSSIVLAVGISTAVGLIFGIYPALKAAKLNPIDALRYE